MQLQEAGFVSAATIINAEGKRVMTLVISRSRNTIV